MCHPGGTIPSQVTVVSPLPPNLHYRADMQVEQIREQQVSLFPPYHHLFTLSARSYTIPRNFYDAFSTPVAINLIRFRDFGERLIGEDARGSSSKGLLVYPPLVLAATVCGYDRTRYVARTVQQLLLASTTRRRDGSRRNKLALRDAHFCLLWRLHVQTPHVQLHLLCSFVT